MGQVPRYVYGIAGDGRLARHLAHYFDLLNIPYRHWSRRMEADGKASASEALGSCDTILVALRDDAIESWISGARSWAPQARFVHFSGALATPLAPGMHPLMTFGPELYARGV